MPENYRIYVDNHPGAAVSDWSAGSAPNDVGYRVCHVSGADAAFRNLPPTWNGSAEIIFTVTGVDYRVDTGAVYFGAPIGPEAKPLVIRGGYIAQPIEVTGISGDNVITRSTLDADSVIGAVLMRSDGTAVSIRGNSAGPNTRVFLQGMAMGSIVAGHTFVVQRPAVTLFSNKTLHLTSHDGRSINLTLIGIKIKPGANLGLFNVRVQCDTCELEPANFSVYTNSRIQGGSDDSRDPRAQAGVYIHSADASNLINVFYGSILGGHLTFRQITVKVGLGSIFRPISLEAWNAPIQIVAGGLALGPWGGETNKARIRYVEIGPSRPAGPNGPAGPTPTGDGLLVANGGSIASPNLPISLNIFGCGRDGVRVDNGSSGSFGPPGRAAGLVTEGEPNGAFGMNVRNGSRALVGSDMGSPTPLRGASGQVALDDSAVPRGWDGVNVAPPAPTGSVVHRSIP